MTVLKPQTLGVYGVHSRMMDRLRVVHGSLPRYQGQRYVADYTGAQEAFALNITMAHLPGFDPYRPGRTAFGRDVEVLLVQRASGHGRVGSWSGVSGYIDTVYPGQDFDPILYTMRAELREECGMQPDLIQRLPFYLGRWLEAPKYGGGLLHVLPILAIYPYTDKPRLNLSAAEVSACKWVKVRDIPLVEGIGSGYMRSTLPRVLAAFPS